MKKNLILVLFVSFMQITFSVFSIYAQTGTVQIGNGTLYNSTSAHPTPYGTFYKNHRVQYLYLASELSGAGLTAGNITELAFNVEALNNCTSMPNFTIKAKLTTENVLTTTFDNSGFITVFTDPLFLPTSGWNTHTLSTPIYWDGTSNLLIDICFDLIANYTQNASVYYTTTSSYLSSYYRSDSSPACGTTNTSTLSYNRANIKITGQLATCLPPTLSISNITSSSATINFTSTASEFELEYGLQGFTLGTGTRINNIYTSNYTITGLNPTTNYQVYVRSICSVGDTSSWTSISFNTPCLEITSFPWLEDFNGSTFPPDCWMRAQGLLDTTTTFTSTTTSYWTTDGFANVGTTGAAKINIYGTSRNEWLITPIIDLGDGTNNYKLEFDLALTAFGSTNPPSTTGTDDKFAVVISTDGGTTWSSVNTLKLWDNQGSTNVYNNISPSGEHVIINLTGYTNYVRIGFYGESTVSNADNDLFIDNVTIKQLTTCPDPYNLTVTNITSSSADLSWTAGGSETSWNIEYGLLGFNQGTGTIINGVTNPFALTGLNPNTAYTFYVQADCGGGELSPWSTPKTFITSQIPATLPYYIDFESGIEQWTLLNGSATNQWVHGSATAYSGTHSVYISNDNGISNTYSITSPSVVHFYRDVTFPSTTNPLMLEFAWKGYGESASFDFLKVYMIPTSQTPQVGTQLTATQLGNTYNMQNTWQNAVIQLPDTLAGKTKRFVFSWYNDVSVGTQPPAAVDDIRFYELTCPKPTSLAATNITQNSTDLSWTAGGSETLWQLEWGQAGFSLGNGTFVDNLSSPTYSLTGLTASTSYSFYVRGICNVGDTSTWAGPYNFTTLCDAVTAIYTQNFDGVNVPALPNCWSSIVLFSSGSPSVVTSTTSPSTSPNCAALYNSTASGTSTHILLITPQFSDLPTHTTQITFKARMVGSGTGVLYVGTMTDPTNPGTFSNYQTIMTLTTDWQEFTVAFNNYSGSNEYIAFKHGLGMTNQYIYIDDVSYEPIPTCPKPTNLTINNITGTDATLSWTAGGTETSWDIEYGPAGFVHGSGTLIQNINTTTYNLIGLNPSTTYQAYVLAQCSSSDSSLWLGPVTFTTTQIPATLPYTWDFENDFNGWSVINGTQTNKWYAGTATFYSPTKSAYISNTNGTTNNYDGSVTSITHIYRDIQFPAGSEFVMTFNWKCTGESSHDYMRIFLENTTFDPIEGVLPTQNQIGRTYYNQQSTWKTDTILFDGSVANSIKRLIFTWKNDASVTYQPPIAIDDIDIHVVTCPKPINLTVSNLTSSSATLSWTEQGSATQWQIEYGLQGFTLGTGTSQLAFTNPVNLSGLSSGVFYNYYVRSICGAGDTSFWAGPFTFYIPCDATTATYTENFDGIAIPNLPPCWTNKIVASTTYAYVKTSTSSPSSSPNCIAMYNSNAQGANTHILLISPPFSDLSNHSNRIRFNLKGSTTEKLIVGTITNPNDETTFTPFDTISIPSNTVWTEVMVSFFNYNGTDQYIAFKHATQTTYTYIYIDDFIYEPLPTIDLAVSELIQPITGCGLSSNEPITIKVKNLASQSYSNINVAYSINNGTPVATETIAQTLNPGDSLVYTFNATADLSSYSIYMIKAFVIDPNDEDHSNDTIIKNITNAPIISTFPYFEDFEANDGYWSSGGVLNSWQWGIPAGTIINSAASGNNAWVTNLSGNYNNNENSFVVSPCFDFSSLTQPYISLKRFVHSENSYDGAALQYSIDGGISWQHLGSMGDPNNWYNDNTVNGLQFSGSQEGWTGTAMQQWVTSLHNASILAGQPQVKFRIAFGSDNIVNSYEGFAFDDFKIFEPIDLAIVHPVDSSTSYLCGLTNNETVSIWIKNVSLQPVNAGEQIPVWYQLDNNTPVADTLTLTNTLQSGDSIQFTFNQQVDLSALTTYLFRYWIHYSSDYNTSNDSILNTIVNYVLTVNISGGDTVCVDPIFLPYTLTLQSNPYGYDTYYWSNQSGTLTGTNSMFDAPAFGWYYVTVTKGACTAHDSIFVCNILNINSLSNENITVYPSPAPIQLNIVATSLPIGNYNLNLTTIDGKTIITQSYANVTAIKTLIPTAHLPQGVYFLTISNNERIWKFKIIR